MTLAALLRVDVHVHLGGLGTGGSGITVSPRFSRSLAMMQLRWTLGVTPERLARADHAYVEELAGLVRASRSIDRAVALAMDGCYRDGSLDRERSPLVIPNDWSRDAARRHPDALLYGASVNPTRPDALDELDRVAADGAVLVKWLPNVMAFDPADKAHAPFYRKLAALRLPLLSHVGAEFTLPGGRHALGDPLRLRRALEEGVTVIAAHCGTLARCRPEGEPRACSGREMLARLMAVHPNLHADLSALTSIVRGWALRRVLDDERLRPRLLDASDFPVPVLAWTQAGRVPLRTILEARRIANPFDRDRHLKVAAGLTDDMTRRAATLLRMPREAPPS
jgi:predicted TIM-barrel fold metal-dependent hydrolase